MKKLIIPDIHQNTAWATSLLERYGDKVDGLILLGDFFDTGRQHFNEPDVIEDTAVWLKELLWDPRCIVLLGNHDLQYRFVANGHLKVPGYNDITRNIIWNTMTELDWSKAKLCHFEDGWLFSHAGVCEKVFSHPTDGMSIPRIETACNRAIEKARIGDAPPELMAGVGRNGQQPRGGITWLDWRREFEPVKGLNQVVGHSHQREPQWNNTAYSRNLCLDCNQQYAAIMEDGVITTFTA